MMIIELFCGMVEVSMIVCGLQFILKLMLVKQEGVSFINNSVYINEGVLVWRVYGVGYGKFYFGIFFVNNVVVFFFS